MKNSLSCCAKSFLHVPRTECRQNRHSARAKFAETRRRLSWEFRFVLTITLHWPTFRSLSEFANPMSSPPRPGTSIFEIYAILTPKIGFLRSHIGNRVMTENCSFIRTAFSNAENQPSSRPDDPGAAQHIRTASPADKMSNHARRKR